MSCCFICYAPAEPKAAAREDYTLCAECLKQVNTAISLSDPVGDAIKFCLDKFRNSVACNPLPPRYGRDAYVSCAVSEKLEKDSKLREKVYQLASAFAMEDRACLTLSNAGIIEVKLKTEDKSSFTQIWSEIGIPEITLILE